MAITKNDELNIASYEQYFGEMELSEKEKKDRIQLAHKFEDAFLLLFAMAVQEDENADSCYCDCCDGVRPFCIFSSSIFESEE